MDNKLSGIKIITNMLKKYNYDLIVKIGNKKNMNSYEIEELIDEFWKVTYYTPNIVNKKQKEDIQAYFIY
tara:strand:- start:140 stop:349 length:210 start_codon:yes stop_codon:yes gene_type:complete